MPNRPDDSTRRAKPPNPGHSDWEVLCALLPAGRVLDLYEHAGRVTHAILPATRGQMLATAVARPVALSLVARGWLARTRSRPAGDSRVTSYRLSLRGWYAVRRLRPDLAAGSPASGPRLKLPPPAAPTEMAPNPPPPVV